MKTFKLNNRRPLAVLSLSAFYALGIFDTKEVQCDEAVLVAFYNDEERGRNVATNEEILWKQFAEMQETVKE